MAIKAIRYAIEGWGVGELWLDGDRLVWHELPRAGQPSGETTAHPLVAQLESYFAGKPTTFDRIPLDFTGYSPLYRRLAEALRAVPWGEVVSYGELAALAGRPRAQRAAGTFCARNRYSIVVPCHRVVAAKGIGSFGELGIEYKRRLLALEGIDSLVDRSP